MQARARPIATHSRAASSPPPSTQTGPPSERQYKGFAHGIHLGKTLIRKTFDGVPFDGVVASFYSPWFKVYYTDGDAEDLKGCELAQYIMFTEDLFYDPRAHSLDYSIVRPYDNPGWAQALRNYLIEFSVAVPTRWLEGAGFGTLQHQPDLVGKDFVSAERLILDKALDGFMDDSRAPRTFNNLRNFAIKFLSFFASRGMPLPPCQRDFAAWLSYVALKCDNVGAVAVARNAATCLGNLNGWDTDKFSKGISAAPGDAMRRRHRLQVKKSAGLKVKHIKRIMKEFCFERPGRPTELQWELAIGIAIAIAFKLLLRYDCLCRCCWDDGFCDVRSTHVTFFLDKRKNHQARGNRLTVARQEDRSEQGVYDLCVLGKRLFQKGHVLPAINKRGCIDNGQFMEYKPFIHHLRQTLIAIGMPETRAQKYAGQSMRSGGATSAAVHGLSPAEICQLAGVSDINWLVYYNRHHLASRIRASRAIGL